METPAITIKLKGVQAAKALCANPQLVNCLQAKAAAGAGGVGMKAAAAKGAAARAAELEAGRGAFMGKAGFFPGAEMEGQFLPGMGKGGLGFGAKTAAGGKASALAGKGIASYGWFGLGPWGAVFLLSSVGLAAAAYYFYRQTQGPLDAIDVEGTPPAAA